MFQLLLCKEFKKTAIGPHLVAEDNFLCFQVNPIIGHLNFLLYDWKREVNHSLIKTSLKKFNSQIYDFDLLCCKKKVYSQYIYIIYIYICIYNGQKDPPSQMGSSEFLNETKIM